ncbi:MAG: MATE family efflux transporter [Devosiaceae bacterium]|nr:MATE family efflux transporter [Devosiaceae bacterium]
MNKVQSKTVNNKDVLLIAVPATLAFITEPLAGLVDLTVIGRLGDAGLLAGVVLGGLAFATLISLMFFLRLGTAGLTAQAIGAKQKDDGLIHFVRAAILGLVFSIVFIIFMQPIISMAAVLLAPSENSSQPYETYFMVRIISSPFVLVNFALLGWFYGRAAATTGMVLQLLIHIVNIILSIAFVYLFNMGVFGVALATLIGQVVAAFVGLYLVFRHFGTFEKISSLISISSLLNIKAIKRLFSLSRDLMIRSAVLMFTFAWFTAQVSRMGDVVLAANEILIYFMLVTAYFLDGQAQAAEALCGRALGAKDKANFIQAIKLTSLWGFGIGFLLLLFWLIFGTYLIDFMSTNEAIREQAKIYIFVAALTAITGVGAFVLDGVMAGATLGSTIRNGMVASAAIYLISAIILQNLFGLNGLWAAMHVFFLARTIIFAFALRAKMPKLFK